MISHFCRAFGFQYVLFLAWCYPVSIALSQAPGAPQQTALGGGEEVEQANTALPLEELPTEPVVAKVEMKLNLKGELVDTIEKGDLLTVLEMRDGTYVIQTHGGHKGLVSRQSVALLADSIPVYDELIVANPADGRLYTLRASAHWAMGDAVKALADYDQAIESGYAEAHAFASRGLFHSAMGNAEQAVQDFTTAIEKNDADPVPRINRAGVHMTQGNYGEAVEDYTQALRLQPESPVLYSQRAIAYKLLGDLSAAEHDYDSAIEYGPQDVSNWMGRGYIRFQRGQHELAIEDFTRVIELAPHSAVAYNNRGYNYQLMKDYVAAKENYQRAIELAPRYLLALQNQAWLLATCPETALQEPAIAIELSTKICELTEYKNVGDLMLLAASHAAAGEFESAIGWQEKVVPLVQDSPHELEVGQKILRLYQNQKPLDVGLLTAADESQSAAISDQQDLDESAKKP
ncbi:MAG: tetratricopeptide repeat protein [Planctomycetales bacterium]|nr:tetratricopeptide repeat protein [Planctomycetales bacterium]